MLALLAEHRDIGVHTELLSEGFVELVEKGVITGTRKRTHRNKIITTTALGTKRLFDFVADNPGVEFWPVDETNNPRKIAEEPHFTSINATIEVDFLGQCAVLSEGGQAFIVLHSTTSDGETSRIVPRLHPGAAVTTFKNVVDRIVTEYGVAELRGSTIAERTRRLIDIAHPNFRDELTREAHGCGYLSGR